MTKPGRNEPCYCGSGRKYKKCHMPIDKEKEQQQRQLADAARWLRQDFLKYGRDERFAEDFALALALYWNNHYTLDNAEDMSQEEAFRFVDWFVFDYQPADKPRLIDLYHEENGENLALTQQQVLESWLDAPAAGAYELLDYEGQQLQVRDFMSGENFEIYEPAGHGLVEKGDLLLGRLVPVQERLEFSTIAAYLPQDEIADLKEKLEAARQADTAEYPDADLGQFMHRNGYLIIHHALEQAEIKGRPPVAGKDPDRDDDLARKTAHQLRKLQSRTLRK